VPISAVDTVSLAFEHTKRQLFQPFRFGQWTRLAFVGLLAGELGSGGKPNFNPGPSGSAHPAGLGFPKIDPAILVALIATIAITALILFVVFLYISSVMRFVLFDSVLKKECHIREGWNRRQGIAWPYFLWQIGFTLVTFAVAIVLFGIPALFAYTAGWFRSPKEHIAGLVLGGVVVVCLFLAFCIVVAVVHVMTKDFVVPQMALEGIGPIEAWRRLLPTLQSERGSYAGYIGMKIVLAIGAGILVTIATLILGLLVALPVIGVAIAAVVAGKTAGLTWNVFTITAAVVAGCVLLAIFLYLIAMISVPVIVFFPAYSIYFFAARYRALSVVLYPPPAATVTNPLPPDLPPAAAPA
jgi:hypothetical protein